MPAKIVTETCPAPECNLSQKDIERFLNELKKYMKLFKPAFQRMEQMKKSLTYLHGLLGSAARKNVEQMALGLREKVRSLQYFVGQSQWDSGASDRRSIKVDRRDVGRRGWSRVDR